MLINEITPLRVSRIAMRLAVPGQAINESAYTGSRTVTSTAPGFWTGSAEFAPIKNPDEYQKVVAFFASLEGAKGTFQLPTYLRSPALDETSSQPIRITNKRLVGGRTEYRVVRMRSENGGLLDASPIQAGQALRIGTRLTTVETVVERQRVDVVDYTWIRIAPRLVFDDPYPDVAAGDRVIARLVEESPQFSWSPDWMNGFAIRWIEAV